MSKGLGPVQRRVLETLNEAPANEGLPVAGLKARVGVDRSNTRRAVRALALRGLVEEATVGSERRVRLTFWGAMVMSPLPEPEDPRAELKALKAKWAEEGRRRALERERAREEARLEALAEPFWYGYAPQIVRRRRPGPTQRTILAVLWEHADPLDAGLPVPVVKAIVSDNLLGTDRSNVRRTIRTLLLRGEIEESRDGEHIRLAEKTALWASIFPPISPEPIDEDRAKAILQAHRGSQVVA